MQITRSTTAAAYEAALHHGMQALRLQGLEAGGPTRFWVGLSHFDARGGASEAASTQERVYVLLEGRMEVRSGGERELLHPLDACYIPPGEVRSLVNPGPDRATMLVIVTTSAGTGH